MNDYKPTLKETVTVLILCIVLALGLSCTPPTEPTEETIEPYIPERELIISED